MTIKATPTNARSFLFYNGQEKVWNPGFSLFKLSLMVYKQIGLFTRSKACTYLNKLGEIVFILVEPEYSEWNSDAIYCATSPVFSWSI